MSGYILNLACPDKPGIVHAVTGIFALHRHNILDLQQFSDRLSHRFFMRVHFTPQLSSSDASSTEADIGTAHLDGPVGDLAATYAMDWDIRPAARKMRVAVLVSKQGHCLNELLFRMKTGRVNIEIPLIISNHNDLAPLAASYNIPFHHLPVNKETKPEQEAAIIALCTSHNIELVVMARYMQILTSSFVSSLGGPSKIINIHHSFLPSFKGAKPYHQAFDRGVKIVGATAHFVTADLDEGPIIEQNVVRVNHGMEPRELVEEGADVESRVLATAVGWVADKRVFLNGSKTVVFS